MIMGIVMQDGSFELSCGSLGKGAAAGEYDVVIEWKQRSHTRMEGAAAMPDDSTAATPTRDIRCCTPRSSRRKTSFPRSS